MVGENYKIEKRFRDMCRIYSTEYAFECDEDGEKPKWEDDVEDERSDDE